MRRRFGGIAHHLVWVYQALAQGSRIATVRNASVRLRNPIGDTVHRTTIPSPPETLMSTDWPESHADLLERPLFAHLATIRPDGSPQSSVMWFAWDGPGPGSPTPALDRSTGTCWPMDGCRSMSRTLTTPTGLWRSEVGSNRWTLIRMPASTAASGDGVAGAARRGRLTLRDCRGKAFGLTMHSATSCPFQEVSRRATVPALGSPPT
jgi:hypothetical protein